MNILFTYLRVWLANRIFFVFYFFHLYVCMYRSVTELTRQLAKSLNLYPRVSSVLNMQLSYRFSYTRTSTEATFSMQYLIYVSCLYKKTKLTYPVVLPFVKCLSGLAAWSFRRRSCWGKMACKQCRCRAKIYPGRENISASRDFTVCIMRCVYRAELILGR